MKPTYTILIIEDEKAILTALTTKLKAVGFEVITAENGSDGVKTAIEKHPDLILLDMVLPMLDGLSVLDQLRSDAWGKEVPVIVLTNLTQVEAEEESKARGVSAYLIKTDWKLTDVLQKIKDVLHIHE
jgi:DNA-binding response OmpR family regulator